MDIIIILLLLAVAVWAVRKFLAGRRPEPPEDTWVVPPATPGAPTPLGPQVLDREALLHRDRTLDPSKWDNSPDYLSGTDLDEPVAEDAPQHFDRAWLERQREQRRPGGDDA